MVWQAADDRCAKRSHVLSASVLLIDNVVIVRFILNSVGIAALEPIAVRGVAHIHQCLINEYRVISNDQTSVHVQGHCLHHVNIRNTQSHRAGPNGSARQQGPPISSQIPCCGRAWAIALPIALTALHYSLTGSACERDGLLRGITEADTRRGAAHEHQFSVVFTCNCGWES